MFVLKYLNTFLYMYTLKKKKKNQTHLYILAKNMKQVSITLYVFI